MHTRCRSRLSRGSFFVMTRQRPSGANVDRKFPFLLAFSHYLIPSHTTSMESMTWSRFGWLPNSTDSHRCVSGVPTNSPTRDGYHVSVGINVLKLEVFHFSADPILTPPARRS